MSLFFVVMQKYRTDFE